MVTIAEFRVPASDTALGPTFEDVPSLVCEIEQVIAADDLGVWLSGADLSAINSALKSDPTVVAHSVIRNDENSWLYNIEFSDKIAKMFLVVVEEGGTMLAATARDGMWTIQLRFSAREDASQIYERLTKRDIQVDILQIQSISQATADEIGLTPEQYEALTAAIQYGYFEIPREISLEELATKLDISHQSLSERFRRAYRTLVTTELETNAKVDNQVIALVKHVVGGEQSGDFLLKCISQQTAETALKAAETGSGQATGLPPTISVPHKASLLIRAEAAVSS